MELTVCSLRCIFLSVSLRTLHLSLLLLSRLKLRWRRWESTYKLIVPIVITTRVNEVGCPIKCMASGMTWILVKNCYGVIDWSFMAAYILFVLIIILETEYEFEVPSKLYANIPLVTSHICHRHWKPFLFQWLLQSSRPNPSYDYVCGIARRYLLVCSLIFGSISYAVVFVHLKIPRGIPLWLNIHL